MHLAIFACAMFCGLYEYIRVWFSATLGLSKPAVYAQLLYVYYKLAIGYQKDGKTLSNEYDRISRCVFVETVSLDSSGVLTCGKVIFMNAAV
jgi:hypothetical protein